MKATAQQLDLIAPIYDSEPDSEHWLDLPAEIAEAANAKLRNIILYDSRNSEVTLAAGTYGRPIFAWLTQKIGVKSRIVARLHDHGVWFNALTFLSSKGRGIMMADEEKEAQIILPHVAKAIWVTRPFNTLILC